MAASLERSRHEGRLRVVCWNMAHRATAWAALKSLEPDISLLTEAVVPGGSRGVWSRAGTYGRDGAERLWTAAVMSDWPLSRVTDAQPRYRGKTRDVPFECSRPGSWEAARIETPMGSALTAVALYGLMDELSDASVHRSLSELSPVLDDPRYKKLVLVGGDLNTGTQWSKTEQRWNARDRSVLDRIAALGLVDCLRAKRAPGRLEGCRCLEGDDCAHVRTRTDRQNPSIPYQTDYLFASAGLASRLTYCEALASDERFAMSDHAPIVADFKL
jgi:hypothetical protein